MIARRIFTTRTQSDSPSSPGGCSSVYAEVGWKQVSEVLSRGDRPQSLLRTPSCRLQILIKVLPLDLAVIGW